VRRRRSNPSLAAIDHAVGPFLDLFVAIPLLFVGVGLIAYGTVAVVARVVTATSRPR
jgi:hypothetical protein